MTVATQFPTANETVLTGWTNPNNAHADDGSYATAAPAGKNTNVAGNWYTFGFDSVIPSGSTIDAVKIIYEYKVSTQASIATMRVLALIGGVAEENHDHATEPLADTVVTVDITPDRTWTRDNLLNANFKVQGDARRGNDADAVTFSLDYIKVEVTYTEPATQLTISDMTVAVAAETLALVQHQVLSISDALVAIAAEVPALTQHQVLTIADMAVAIAAEIPALTQHQVLTIADALVAVLAEVPTLTAHDPSTQLVISDMLVSVAAEVPSLTQHQVLSISDALVSIAADILTLTAHDPSSAQLTIADMLVSVLMESPSLVAHDPAAPPSGGGWYGRSYGTRVRVPEKRPMTQDDYDAPILKLLLEALYDEED